MPARHSVWEAARRGGTLPHEAQRWPGVGWCVASLRLLGAGGQRAEPPGRLLHFFSSSREAGRRSRSPWGPGPSPHEPTGLLHWGARSGSACGGGPWNGGGGPPQKSRAQRGSSSRHWRTGASPTQPYVQGPRLPLLGSSAPTTLTRTLKAPPWRQGPDYHTGQNTEGWGARAGHQ